MSSRARRSRPSRSNQPAAWVAPVARWAVKQGDRWVLLKADEVDWIEAAANYVRLHARGVAYLMRGTLSGLERTLDPARFVRIHRSTAVRLAAIKEIQPWFSGDYLVILHDGMTASEADIAAHARDRLAGYKRPRSVSFIAESDMPRTATGKILHRVLRDRLGGQ